MNKRKARVLKKNSAKKSNSMASSASRSGGPPRVPGTVNRQSPSNIRGGIASPELKSLLFEYYMERYGNLNGIICKVNPITITKH